MFPLSLQTDKPREILLLTYNLLSFRLYVANRCSVSESIAWTAGRNMAYDASSNGLRISWKCFLISLKVSTVSLKCFPVSWKCFPVSWKCFPVFIKCFPVSWNHFPVSNNCFLVSQKCFLVSWKCVFLKKTKFSGNQEAFSGDWETCLGNQNTFLGNQERFLGNRETFSGNRETFSENRETFSRDHCPPFPWISGHFWVEIPYSGSMASLTISPRVSISFCEVKCKNLTSQKRGFLKKQTFLGNWETFSGNQKTCLGSHIFRKLWYRETVKHFQETGKHWCQPFSWISGLKFHILATWLVLQYALDLISVVKKNCEKLTSLSL